MCCDAIQSGHTPELAKQLATDKDVIYCRDKTGNTLLHIAVKANHMPSVQCLITHNADLNALNHLEETPLMTAIRTIQCGLVIIMSLLEKGAEPNLTNYTKESPLYQALIYSHLQHTTDRLMILLKYEVNLNAVCAHDMYPLECAIYLDNPLLVSTLLLKGANIEQRNSQGLTLFSIGINFHSNYKFIIDCLLKFKQLSLKKQAILTKQDCISIQSTFRALLDHAIVANHYNLVIALLPYVENINQYNGCTTPLLLALSYSNTKPTIITALLDRDPDLNATDFQGNTPLHLAIKRHTPAIAGALLMHGANPNTTSRNQCPLFTALKQSRARAQYVRLLLAWGADYKPENYLMPSQMLLQEIEMELTAEKNKLTEYNRDQSDSLTRLLLAEPGINTWIKERQNMAFFKTNPFPFPKELHDCIIEHLVPKTDAREIQQWPIDCNAHFLYTPYPSPMLR